MQWTAPSDAIKFSSKCVVGNRPDPFSNDKSVKIWHATTQGDIIIPGHSGRRTTFHWGRSFEDYLGWKSEVRERQAARRIPDVEGVELVSFHHFYFYFYLIIVNRMCSSLTKQYRHCRLESWHRRLRFKSKARCWLWKVTFCFMIANLVLINNVNVGTVNSMAVVCICISGN